MSNTQDKKFEIHDLGIMDKKFEIHNLGIMMLGENKMNYHVQFCIPDLHTSSRRLIYDD